MKSLIELLGEDLANQVTAKLGTVKLLIQEKDGDYIPKERFDEVNTKKNELSTELEKKTKSLEKLQKDLDKNTKTVEDQLSEAQKEIDRLKSESEAKEKALSNTTKEMSLEKELMNAKVKAEYLPLLKREFNLDELEIENGSIKGFEEKIKPLQTKFKDLFGKVDVKGVSPTKPNLKDDSGDIYTLAELNSLSQSEAVRNIDKVNRSMEALNQ